jgi:hypothetical protein
MTVLKDILSTFFMVVGGSLLVVGFIGILVVAKDSSEDRARDAAEEACKPHAVLTTYEYNEKKFVCLGHEVREVKE